MRTFVTAMGLALFVCFSPAAFATIKSYEAIMSGLGENPPNGSPGTGYGTAVLDDVALTLTVNESWSGLVSPATASHIHTSPSIGVNGPVTFPFSGVPNATAGAIPQQVFSITPAQIASLDAGLMYFNVHTSAFPGGEIRGAIVAVPEPATLSVLALAGIPLLRRRK